jgi:hypothetical protein
MSLKNCTFFPHVYLQEGVKVDGAGGAAGAAAELEEVQPEPLDLSIPTDSCAKTITYFILLPIVFPLWLTLPDTRKQTCK